MTKIDIVIPTRNRKDKLAKCLRSAHDVILASSSYSVIVKIFFSSMHEKDEFDASYGRSAFIQTHLYAGTFRASTFWNDYLRGMSADALLYLSDDTAIDEDIINKSIPKLEEFNFDGVVGFKIRNATDGQPAKAAYGLVGSVFADRFPDRKVFCPDYGAFFCDVELEEFAKCLGRFCFCEEAQLEHYHPAFNNSSPDETHLFHRAAHARSDMNIRDTRRAKNILWGKSFELISKGA